MKNDIQLTPPLRGSQNASAFWWGVKNTRHIPPTEFASLTLANSRSPARGEQSEVI